MAYRNMHHPVALSGRALDDYLARGWYRMHQSVFTITHTFRESLMDFCPVWWLRFPVSGLEPHASHTRIRRRVRGFEVRLETDFVPDADSEALYARYLASVPFDGYASITDALYGDAAPQAGTIFHTQAFVLSDQGRDVAMGIFDLGERSAASILHFYDPGYARYSLGKYLILLTIDHIRSLGCEWYYPGYVVSGDRRFDYKLFLGRAQALYFDPSEQGWKPFQEEMLERDEGDFGDWEDDFDNMIF